MRKMRMKNFEEQEYREHYQQRQYSRDYDLIDPNKLRKEQPPRVCKSIASNEPTALSSTTTCFQINDTDLLHASAIQQFNGEDLKKSARVQRQQQQVRAWAAAQIQAKEDRQQKEKEEDLYVAILRNCSHIRPAF